MAVPQKIKQNCHVIQQFHFKTTTCIYNNVMWIYTYTQICVFFLGNCKDYKFSNKKQSEFKFYISFELKLLTHKKLVRGLWGPVLTSYLQQLYP